MTVCFWRDFIRDLGGYPEVPLKEDYALWARAIARGARVANLPQVLVRARRCSLRRRRYARSSAGAPCGKGRPIAQSGSAVPLTGGSIERHQQASPVFPRMAWRGFDPQYSARMRDHGGPMTCQHQTRRHRAAARVLLLCAALAQTAAQAAEVDAKRLLKAMSDYMAAQKAVSFDFDSSLDIVSTQQQRITLATSGSVVMNRPDKLHVTRRGGFANMELSFDGKTVTLLGKNSNMVAQVEAAGTIDQLVDVLRDKYHRPVPGADLLMSDPYKEWMPEVTDIKDLGSGVIRGVECDHLAFRTREVDW